MNEKKTLLILFGSCLILLNIYQVHNSHLKSERISQIEFEYQNLKLQNSFQNNLLNQQLFLESLLFDTVKVNIQTPSPDNKFFLVSLFPDNSCGACILHDSRLIEELKKKYSDQISIYALSHAETFSKKHLFPENLDYIIIRNINELIALSDDFNYTLNSPLHLLINSNKEVISVHLTNFYLPENSNLFFKKIESLI